MVHEKDVATPMRDGVELSADVYRPEGHEQVPVLVARTPYGKEMARFVLEPQRLVDAGFAVVLQDCRGRFESDGEWAYVGCEVDDGYDTVEWAAAQPWSNGRVGMFGPSYLGYTQWLAAVAGPPHLEAIAPECCAADYWVASFETGGAFRMAVRMGWTSTVVATMAGQWGIDDPTLSALAEAAMAGGVALAKGDTAAAGAARERTRAVLDGVYRTRPFNDNPLWQGRATWLDEIFDHERRDDANWRRINPSSHYDGLDLPAVHVGGWYDIHLGGVLDNYTGMQRQAPTERARSAQRLVVGPWSHWTPLSPIVGGTDFGPDAVLDMTALRLAWFGHWLAGGPAPADPPVRIFVMGENRWRGEQEWPLARTVFTPWYLQAGGGLDPVAPGATTAPDRFTYDPRDPAPTIGGRLLGIGDVAGPFDQRPVGERADVLVYTSEPLAAPLEITGPLTLELWAATDAPDTDFCAVLLAVAPDGTATNLAEGAVRARHSGHPVPLAAGAVYPFTIDLVATSIVLGAGHRVGLHVSSSSFPMWEPNPNTGNPVGTDTDDDLRVAHQAVFHDPAHPSRLMLPVIPR